MSLEPDDQHRNFIEAKIIIQEFHDDPTVFLVGTAPFGKLWFDDEKIEQQYKVLTDSWFEEYGDNETQHSKRPRIVSVLIDEKDPMFNRYRDNIKEAQEKKQSVGDVNHSPHSTDENVVIETSSTTTEIPDTPKPTSPKKTRDENKTCADNKKETTIKKKRGRPKKQPGIKDSNSITESTK